MSSDSPAKTKSHYFVQRYEDDEGNKYCAFCGKKFHSTRKIKKYCSYECYLQGVKTTKAIWYQKNKEDRERKNKAWYHRTKIYKLRPVPNYLLSQIKRKRCTIIKQELIQLELLTRQIRTAYFRRERNQDFKLPPRTKKMFDPERIDFIKDKLTDLGLPFGEVYPLEIPTYKGDIKRRRKYPKPGIIWS